MKKILVLLLAFILLILSACSDPTTPTGVVESELKDIKSNSESILGDNLVAFFGEEGSKEFVDAFVDFDYKIGEEVIDKDKATVEVTITTYQFDEIMKNFVAKYTAEAFTSASTLDAQASITLRSRIITEELDNAEKTLSQTLTVSLEKVDDKWVVQASDEMTNLLSGNIMNYVNSFAQ